MGDSIVLVPNLAASWPGGESCVLVPNCQGNLKASYHSQTWGSASEVSVLLVFSESLPFRSVPFSSVPLRFVEQNSFRSTHWLCELLLLSLSCIGHDLDKALQQSLCIHGFGPSEK